MSQRKILSQDAVAEPIRTQQAAYHKQVLDEVIAALPQSDVVVVGMAQNPFCKRARKALDGAGKPYKYLEYGSYLSEWKPRLAIKMWSGWPTFPQVFVKGTLVGGAEELEKLIASGELDRLLAS